ncbi:hypothetical protein POM88_030253 [Heracleum sosnowskyi]|uniref:Transposase n=1 Tax=Heracleum sosnowskyi TaxID=360622 RepID=A0AAD8HVL4_9APIA|nr:hypothetical protein POM88_030253 [Heracleum sosnowskyi]
MLSGWKTAGHLACPHCAHDHDAYNLSHGGKTTWFDNHRKLEPSFDISSRNRLIFYERLEPTGYNWKSISEETQNFYFEEFKKYFAWKQSDAVIYKGWLANARRKYSEFVSVARSNWERYNRRDNRISLDVYLSWVEFWRTENFQKKSSIQKSNRHSGVDGRPSTHTSGSASHRTVAARAKVQYKREPTADLIFYLTHTKRVKKKKNPIAEAIENGMDDEDVEDAEDDGNVEVVWIDKKSQKIYILDFCIYTNSWNCQLMPAHNCDLPHQPLDLDVV